MDKSQFSKLAEKSKAPIDKSQFSKLAGTGGNRVARGIAREIENATTTN